MRRETTATASFTGFQSGFTVLEILMALALTSVIFAGLMRQYSSSTSASYDQSIRIATNLQVQAILQSIGADIRILGNGVPFDQANFQIGEDTLSDPTVTEPIDVATASETYISFRLNETGEVLLLTQDFDPSAALEVYLTDVSGLDVNDPIYISDNVVSGDDGLYATITAVNSGSSSVTISGAYVASPAATFPMGSILEEVSPVIFESPGDGSGITRDSGFGTVLMGANSTMALDYQDINGNSIGLPLTNTAVVGQLRLIELTVSMPSSKTLSTGQTYTATATQTFGIRNLNYVF